MKTWTISLLWFAGYVASQSSSQRASQSQSVVTLSISRSGIISDYLPPITLASDFRGSSIATISRPPISSSTRAANATMSRPTSTQDPLTEIGGANSTVASTSTRTAPARPSNTQPCNNYVEFCNRKYSNITEVCAHNSPFTRQNNAARNQNYGVTQQLNDGIRMLQGQAHYVNGTLYYCHTSCDLLNEGTVEDYLREVTAWVETHPFDVVTILFGNYNWGDKDPNGDPLVTSVDFDAPVRSSGLINYIYQPPSTVMGVADWPTLGQMILSQKRVVTFIDYNYDTTNVPYMLWEFYNMWETPFSPTDINFPCTIGRPDGISDDQAKNMMYIANHNLNAEIAIGGASILVPNTAYMNQTNAVNGTGSLGIMSTECAADWGRPPNFLLVDFYDQGPTPGSVFEVAARANGVTYNRACCGSTTRSLAIPTKMPYSKYLGLAVAVAVALIL